MATTIRPMESRLKQPLEVGDIVRLTNGTSPLRVEGVRFSNYSRVWVVDTKYLFPSNVSAQYGRPARDFVLLKDFEEENIEREEDMTKLYEVDVTKNPLAATKEKVYATKLAVDSEGNWVMEPKGGGTVFSANPKNIEEVLPYTISVAHCVTGHVHSYLAEKGKYEEGAFYMMNNSAENFTIARVTKVDTKSRAATREFKPFGKLSVEKIS